MANLIESNKKLIEQTQSQHLQENTVQVTNSSTKLTKADDSRIKTITIYKDASGFGFNVRGQISSELCVVFFFACFRMLIESSDFLSLMVDTTMS